MKKKPIDSLCRKEVLKDEYGIFAVRSSNDKELSGRYITEDK